MGTLITILFVLVPVVLGIIAVIRIINPSDEDFPSFLKGGFERAWKLLLAAVILIFMNLSSFYADPGTAYAVQYLWGGDAAVTSQGFKMNWLGRVIPMRFEIPIQDTLGFHENQEEGIYYRRGITREFADAIKADIAASLIIGINYSDEVTFLEMADKSQSESKLVYARIIPAYDQALKNTCKLMSAQDYIAGASAQFDYYLRDQLENGMYLTEEKEVVVQTQAIGDTALVRNVISGGTSPEKQKIYTIKTVDGKPGSEPLRDTSNSLKKYGLTVIQAAITSVDWENSFDERLDLQKDQVAQTQLQKQTAEKEYYATLAAVQTGEREKAQKRAKLEQEQLQVTIKAETDAKASQFKAEEEKNRKTAAAFYADRVRLEADADAYRNQRLVSAGLNVSPFV
jgi:hypothetical protein